MKWWHSTLVVIALACGATSASAATCNVSAVDIAFGSIDALKDAIQDTNGTLQVTCSGSIGEPVSYSIALTPGADRNMRGAAGALAFNIYTDPARVRVWGDGSAGTDLITDNFALDVSMVTRTYTVYARIPAGHLRASAGSYSAQLLITVTY